MALPHASNAGRMRVKTLHVCDRYDANAGVTLRIESTGKWPVKERLYTHVSRNDAPDKELTLQTERNMTLMTGCMVGCAKLYLSKRAEPVKRSLGLIDALSPLCQSPRIAHCHPRLLMRDNTYQAMRTRQRSS
jgi:hypothetical protein